MTLQTAEDYAAALKATVRTPKLVLPDVPAHDDVPALNQWLTDVLRLDPAHPVTGAVHQGLRGPDGHVELRRAGAPPLRFEPASTMNSARRFLPALAWQLQPTDGEPPRFKEEHCGRIAHVTRLLCGISAGLSEAAETAGIIGTFLSGAVPIEGHTTYGTGPQRFAAASALQRPLDEHTGRPIGAPRYLVDANTGELVVRVSDLQDAARRHVGASLAHGWLDARLAASGWTRLTLDGHAVTGRQGRTGPHLRISVYRGHLDESVTT